MTDATEAQAAPKAVVGSRVVEDRSIAMLATPNGCISVAIPFPQLSSRVKNIFNL